MDTMLSRLLRATRRQALVLAMLLTIGLIVSCSPNTAAAPNSTPPTTAPSPVPTQPAQAKKALGSDMTEVVPVDGRVSVSMAGLSGGEAVYYVLHSGEKWVPFFVVTGTDGVTRAALDACDVCYESHVGFHQEGDVMVCNACGSRFAVNKISLISGGCNPVGLTVQIERDRVILQLPELQAGQKYF